jgi:hypothetical protein
MIVQEDVLQVVQNFLAEFVQTRGMWVRDKFNHQRELRTCDVFLRLSQVFTQVSITVLKNGLNG